MKIKKYVDPNIITAAVVLVIEELGDTASRLARASIEMRAQVEKSVAQLIKHGLPPPVATGLVAAIVEVRSVCERCGREGAQSGFSGPKCLECAMAIRRQTENTAS